MPVHIHYWQAVILGLLQGLTEFLPVSSTAHMDIAPQLLFHWDDPGAAFSAIVQLGPIVAIVVYFRADLVRYWHGIVRTGSLARVKPDDIDARIGWYTLLGTIPIIIVGFALKHQIETVFRNLNFVAFSLIALAIVLWVAERVGRRDRPLEKLSFKQSQVIGWAQVLALLPGTSRSGVTITAGLFEGLDRESAARFSFLLSIPAIVAAGAFELLKTLVKSRHGGGVSQQLGPSLLGAVVAGVVAYIVITWFLRYMKEHSTGVFIAYRIALGVLVLALLHTGYLHTPPLR